MHHSVSPNYRKLCSSILRAKKKKKKVKQNTSLHLARNEVIHAKHFERMQNIKHIIAKTCQSTTKWRQLQYYRFRVEIYQAFAKWKRNNNQHTQSHEISESKNLAQTRLVRNGTRPHQNLNPTACIFSSAIIRTTPVLLFILISESKRSAHQKVTSKTGGLVCTHLKKNSNNTSKIFTSLWNNELMRSLWSLALYKQKTSFVPLSSISL